jgi:hypothetical protein
MNPVSGYLIGLFFGFVAGVGLTAFRNILLSESSGYRAKSETPNRKPPQGGSGTAPAWPIEFEADGDVQGTTIIHDARKDKQ